MESVTETNWDVVVAGTGLPQSLLALALSRSDKKVLHVDKNEYYGGADAALTLQDAEEWVQQVNAGNASPYSDAAIWTAASSEDSKLGLSRSYSLALSPQIIYTRSALLPTLVSSKVYRQLEFLAVGNWFVHGDNASGDTATLRKIPNSREDIFADKALDLRSKRALISLLRSIRDPEEQARILGEHGHEALSPFLLSHHRVPESLHSAVLALAMSPKPAAETTVGYALPRIARHLASIGVFGPGFGAVIPKWGGLAEVAQVACRAQAVGGGTYMLGKGIQSIEADIDSTGAVRASLDAQTVVSAKIVCGSHGDLPATGRRADLVGHSTRLTAIVSDTFEDLFTGSSDSGPKPTVAIVYFAESSVQHGDHQATHPVYMMIHSSETGECPAGQCVIYASTEDAIQEAKTMLLMALESFLESQGKTTGQILWRLVYKEHYLATAIQGSDAMNQNVHVLNGRSADLVFDDTVLEDVRRVWQHVASDDDTFMEFTDREVGAYDDDDDL